MSKSFWRTRGLITALLASVTALAAPAAHAASPLAYTSKVASENVDYNSDFASRIAIADFNGDGIDDHAISSPNLVTVWFGARGSVDGGGSMRLSAAGATFAVSRGGIAVSAAGDVDGDGFEDLVLASTVGATSAFVVYGAATNPTSLPIQAGARVTAISTGSWGPVDPHAVGIGDFNGDGKDDLVVPSKSGTNTLSGTSSAAIIAGGPRVTTLSAVTAGGRVSLVVGLRSCSQRYSLAWPYVTTVCRTRDPDLAPIGDFNGDGKDDLYLNAKEGNSQAILLGRSGSGFSISAVSPGAGSVSLTAVAANAGVAGFWGSVRAVGDVNGDGLHDFTLPILPTLGGGAAVIGGRANPPASLLSTGDLFRIDGTPIGAAGDQTGDGRDDLLVTRGTAVAIASLPAGTTSFAAATQTLISDLPIPYRPFRSAATVGDLDGDQATDALLADAEGVYRLTHTGEAPPTRLEARTVVVGPTGVEIGGPTATITASCASRAAETKVVPIPSGIAVFDGGGTLTAGNPCTVSSTVDLPYDTCRWATTVTFRGATVTDGAAVTLGANPNQWVKTITCLPEQSTAYPTSFANWRTTGSASYTFDASPAMALTSGLGQTGSAVWANPLNWNNKALEFTLSMNSGNGAAEGVTMAFLNDAGGQPAGGWIGSGGGQLGFGGLSGIALAFDAFKQPEDAQPNTVNWVDGPQGASLRKLYSKDAGLRLRGTPVKVRVVVKDGRLTATLNGKFVHSVAATIPSSAYLAFTGSTSLALWQTQSISGLTITDA